MPVLSYPHHSLIVSGTADNVTKRNIYRKIEHYLSNNYSVIYAAEPKPLRVTNQMSKVMDDKDTAHSEMQIEDYISNGALTIIAQDRVYAADKAGHLDSHEVINTWNSLILKTMKHKPKFKGIVAIGAPLAFVQNNNTNNSELLDYENRMGKSFAKPVQAICWYNDWDSFAKLSFSELVSLLNSHYAIIHNGWFYREWHRSNIASFVTDGIDKVLGKGSSNLIMQTLKFVYRLDEGALVSRPQLFEEKARLVLGDNSADFVFELIADAIRKEMLFSRINASETIAE
jgi:hypothetical protein